MWAWNLCGAVAIAAWTAGTTAILFYTLKYFKVLRVPANVELAGLDMFLHGESAYVGTDIPKMVEKTDLVGLDIGEPRRMSAIALEESMNHGHKHHEHEGNDYNADNSVSHL